MLRERAGMTIGIADAMIASVARARGASAFVTRNGKDFDGIGLRVIDPWTV